MTPKYLLLQPPVSPANPRNARRPANGGPIVLRSAAMPAGDPPLWQTRRSICPPENPPLPWEWAAGQPNRKWHGESARVCPPPPPAPGFSPPISPEQIDLSAI